MARITECSHYILYIRTNDRDRDYPEMNSEYFGNAQDMLNRIDEITRENTRQGMTFTRHIDYDYIYFF